MSQNEEHTLEDLDAAYKAKDLSKIMAMTGLPVDVITGQRIMSRKERRQWYRDNKSRLKLPKWSELNTLSNK